jgi:hypothetical protein
LANRDQTNKVTGVAGKSLEWESAMRPRSYMILHVKWPSLLVYHKPNSNVSTSMRRDGSVKNFEKMSLIEAEVQPTPFSTESALQYWSEPNLQCL